MGQAVSLSAIRIDGGTQPRSKIDEAIVAEYATAMESGAVFPPIAIFFDGVDHWLADGFHRYHAANSAHLDALDAIVFTGTRRDAVLHSVGANTAHGLRRTNEDKRRAVQTLLSDPEWAQWSDREIGRRCGVHGEMVAKNRPAPVLPENGSTKSERTFMHHLTGKPTTMKTENIGRQGLRSGQESKATRVAQITELAASGNVAAQIADEIGVSEGRVRDLANEYGIKLADHQLGKRLRIDNRRVIEQTVLGLEASAASLKTIGVSLSGIDKADAADWATSMSQSIRAFSALRNKLKEYVSGTN